MVRGDQGFAETAPFDYLIFYDGGLMRLHQFDDMKMAVSSRAAKGGS